MHHNKYKCSVKMSDSRRQELFDRLDAISEAYTADNNRGHDRIPYRAPEVRIEVTHPTGGTAQFSIIPRNLSTSGAFFLHGGYLHVGSKCKVHLVDLNDTQHIIIGKVAWCQHAAGSDHIIGVCFDQEIDPRQFVDRALWPESFINAAMGNLQLTGNILYLDDQAIEHKLLAFHLRNTEVDLVPIETIGAALDQIKRRSFDVVICDYHLGNQLTGDKAIRAMFEAGYSGPIILLSAENSPTALEAVKNAGATIIVRKPFDPAMFLQIIADLLESVGATTSDEPIYSELGQQAGMGKMISDYLLQVRKIIEQLNKAIVDDDFNAVRLLCQTLKSTGVGYGFAPLTEAAHEALSNLDASFSVQESNTQLNKLQLLSRRLKLRDNTS